MHIDALLCDYQLARYMVILPFSLHHRAARTALTGQSADDGPIFSDAVESTDIYLSHPEILVMFRKEFLPMNQILLESAQSYCM
jgi:hypothetical protein